MLALIIGGIAGALLLALTVQRLDAQGAYYDELHQVPGAFAWSGRTSSYFVAATAFGLPVMTMTYGSALKSALYGLWLRLTRRPFTIVSWRLTGLLFLASGIVAFSIAAGPSPRIVVVVLALMLTDKTILLSARHDGGPVVFGLVFRLMAMAAWLQTVLVGGSSTPALMLGVFVGLSVFERLHAIVLVPAAALLLVGDSALRHPSGFMAGAIGLALGLLPLIVLNVRSWLTGRRVLSASGAAVQRPEWSSLPAYVGSYLSLGAGAEMQSWILGEEVPAASRLAEGVLMLALVLLCAGSGLAGDLRPALLAGAYLVCSIGIWLLPHPWTEAHHWVIGTPLQYVAIAWVVWGTPTNASVLAARVLLVGLLLVRTPGLARMESLFAAGRSGTVWNPALSRLGEWAAAQPAGARFIAADWGVATQILCFSNARHVPLELYWDYGDREQLRRAVHDADTWYLVALNPCSDVRPDATRRILADASTLHEWQEQPIHADTSGLAGLTVRRFQRLTG